MSAHAFRDAYLKELEKVGVLGTIAGGAAFHGLTNAAVKHLHHPKTGWIGKITNPISRGLAKGRKHYMAEGIKRGLSGKSELGLGGEINRAWGIPELTAGAEPGHRIGRELSTLRPSRRYRALKKLRRSVMRSEHVRNAPVGEDMVGALNRVISDRDAMRAPRQKYLRPSNTPVAQKAIAVGAGVPAMALAGSKPLIHGALNQIRVAVAKSRLGQKFARNALQKGVLGQKPSGVSSQVTDYAVSPAALDPQRLGAAFNAESPKSKLRISGALARVLPRTARKATRAAQEAAQEAGTGRPVPGRAALKEMISGAVGRSPVLSRLVKKFKRGNLSDKDLAEKAPTARYILDRAGQVVSDKIRKFVPDRP